MKLILISFLLSLGAEAKVLDLGIIDNRKQLLDQRFTSKVNQHERIQSLGSFYEYQRQDFIKDINPSKVQIVSPSAIDNEWKKLLEGTI